ncbi:amidohydrolase family protein [Gemmatimonas sp.]|uniref:amidohydrolase family protein n=1 Tax=Gemmatimonas sp. TaxID=1962908 RepID=UPI0033412AFE
MARELSRREFVRDAAAAALVPVLGTAGLLQAQPPASPARERTRRLRSRDFVVEASYALLWRNGRAEVVPDVYVRVRGNDIVAIGTGRVRGTVDRINASGQVLLPGFISGHTHAASGSPTRGLIESGRSYQRPIEIVEQLPDDQLDALTAYNVAELVRSGCTSHVEMSLSLRQAQSYVRVARQWHVRGFPGGMVPGTARLFPIWRRSNDAVLAESVSATLAEIEANRQYALSIRGAEDGLIMPMMTPHAADTHTPETMRAVVAAAKELGTGIHTHLAQGSGEVRTVQRLHGVSPAQWLASLGALDGPFFGAHMTAATADDWSLLQQRGAVYAHCPSGGGAGNSSGSQPYPEALAAGVATNVGIDTHSNDYVENLKLAVICGRARARLVNQFSGTKLPLPSVMQAVSGATHGAADGLRRPDLGRLAVGAKADLCSIDVGGLLVGSGAAGPEPLHNLLYANGHSVRHVFTQGYAQVVDGQLVVADESQLVRNGARVAQTIWAQLRAEGWFA